MECKRKTRDASGGAEFLGYWKSQPYCKNIKLPALFIIFIKPNKTIKI